MTIFEDNHSESTQLGSLLAMLTIVQLEMVKNL
jgi:hypothetical protein